ncbi:universal stress protein [Streptomyces sp. RB6PN25]|uniref:Universal stress protein n=1 Tax=Streptomyces humicola TaxID=2953240 RepID=A0ABT1PSI2_9ACTN|nr:universal stress protein [Streptomyces humicola]MCQ4080619.1 universal stress protein [Streptomyces humicola]
METSAEHAAVVVGVDFTPTAEGALGALAWAADEAALRHLPLHMVHAIEEPPHGYRTAELDRLWSPWHAAVRTACVRELEALRHSVLRRHPDLVVVAERADGRPAEVLAKRAHGATMVVVGSRQLGTARDVFTRGAVGMPLMAQASCPVVVVRGSERAARGPSHLVVVGVDGSEVSRPAVEFAFEEAAFRDAHLLALAAWRPAYRDTEPDADTEQEWRRVLAEATAGWQEKYPEVHVRHELVRGHPVHVLSEAGADAIALVVGTRGMGGFPGLLLGSVSQGVMHHAQCPVVVVPHRSVQA